MEANNVGKLCSEREQTGRTGHDSSSELQGLYQGLFAILLPIVPLKFIISGASSFKGQGNMMSLFVVAACVHNIALREANRESTRSTCYSQVAKLVCHLSGGLACDFLAFILFPAFVWFMMSILIAIHLTWELYCAFNSNFNAPHYQVEINLHPIDSNLNDQHGEEIDELTHQEIIINHLQPEEADPGTVVNDNSVEQEGEVHDSIHQVQILINSPHDPVRFPSPPATNDNSMEQEIV